MDTFKAGPFTFVLNNDQSGSVEYEGDKTDLKWAEGESVHDDDEEIQILTAKEVNGSRLFLISNGRLTPVYSVTPFRALSLNAKAFYIDRSQDLPIERGSLALELKLFAIGLPVVGLLNLLFDLIINGEITRHFFLTTMISVVLFYLAIEPIRGLFNRIKLKILKEKSFFFNQ
ncbi:hypothetical protein [Photobacterium leiognathi]|uniref:hypothetical protein n=1 Tax=Photobacterium leiognathi TaxID=553611 RepID=UPI0029819E24|nr:hypothetical protein [Photobacterium leiognathi]